jgi:ABC-2 type transport system ATP-binding protein
MPREQSSSNGGVIDISGLTRNFASKAALKDVSLNVPRGSVFGLVGENGAGKTTLIKHILGLLRAESGSVRVFGRDPVRDPVSVLAQIGYLAEQPDLPEWMQVREFIRYTRAFYPKWDPAFAEEMRVQFGLDSSKRIRTLSKGQRAKLGLLAAEAHRPELLLLDEPSSGLDPIVRSEILAAIIRSVAEEGRTVFFSSHLLEEVERVSDHVAMLHQGRVVLCGELGAIKTQHRRVTFLFETHQSNPPAVPGALTATGRGREWSVICDPSKAHLSTVASNLRATVVDEHDVSLNEIFIAHAGVPLGAG